ncbi:hypothetical protein [Erwinia sp. E_sp_B01_9]|uniref:hypothetical protein n=1 Tax=Erwinia sp. E_sp_B01_9 TaxID=3039403 RepID=UPI003D9B5A5F
MQEKQDEAYSGAQVGAWFAPDITASPVSGIGEWSQQDLVTYLRTGRLAGKAQAAGSMAEAISHSFQHLSAEDLSAIADYLGSVQGNSNSGCGQLPFRTGQAGQ